MTHTRTEHPELLPCPFCGAGITSIRENGKMWTGQRYSEPTSVSVLHHCEAVDGQPSRVIERVGRDLESAVAAWNHRAPAPQAQRVPLSADEIKEPKNGEAWRVEWWNESLRMMLPSDKVLHRFSAYRNGTIQFTLKARAHGITQEKKQ